MLAKEDTRRQLDEMRDEFEAEREAIEARHAEEMRTRVASAEEHARLDAEQRHSAERSALRAEKHAAVSVVRQQVEAEFGEKLMLQVQQAKWDLEDRCLHVCVISARVLCLRVSYQCVCVCVRARARAGAWLHRRN